jgi:ATP-dependent protease ClpP protease subunit
MKNLLVGSINNNLFGQIVEAVNENDSLCLMIDSYGGDLRAGYKIYDFLKGKDGIHCCVLGNCMSAAILVLLGVKKQNRTANEHSQFLIHRPLLEYHGQLTQKDAQKVDSAIEEETKLLMDVYKKELNASEQALMAMLDNEQVFGAMQAKAMGFVDSVNMATALENDEEALKEIMYNKQLIKNKKMATNDKLEACVKALKDLFASSPFKNTKVVSTLDGKDLKVETDGEVKTGCKIEAENGSYVLGDNRTIIVKNGVIESIEEPKTTDDDKKKLEEKVKNLESERDDLKNKLEKAQKEISDFQNLKNQLESVNQMIDEAGGINAVLNAVSPNPAQKSNFDDVDDDDDAYNFIKSLGDNN